jgi:hypothetical protein
LGLTSIGSSVHTTRWAANTTASILPGSRAANVTISPRLRASRFVPLVAKPFVIAIAAAAPISENAGSAIRDKMINARAELVTGPRTMSILDATPS